MRRINALSMGNTLPIRVTALVSAVLMGCTVASAAEHTTATLETALRHAPKSARMTQDPMPVVFMDVGALSKVSGGALNDAALRRMASFAQLIRPLGALVPNGGKTWTAKAGIPFDKISYFAAFGPADARIAYWGLADAKAATDLLDTLKANGFKDVSQSPVILANGEPRRMNLAQRAADNPWTGPMGQTSAVMALDATVAQASAPEDLSPLAGLKTRLADDETIALAMRGLDAAGRETHGQIVQAVVVTPLIGVSATDPAALLDAGKDQTQIAEAMKKQIAQSVIGIPAYTGGIIADMGGDGGSVFAVSLAYGNCGDAEAAVSGLEARWKEGMKSTASVVGKTMEGTKAGCAAVVRFGPTTNTADAFEEFMRNYAQRGFNVLQIGSGK